MGLFLPRLSSYIAAGRSSGSFFNASLQLPQEMFWKLYKALEKYCEAFICPHIETSQLIRKANQLTGFYMMANEGLIIIFCVCFTKSFQNIFREIANWLLKMDPVLFTLLLLRLPTFSQCVGNKAKGRISKRVFQENKARQIFRKNEHFLTPDRRT